MVRKTPLRTLHNLRLANEHTSFLLRIEACMPPPTPAKVLETLQQKFSVMSFSVVASATNWRMHWIARQIWRGNIVWDTQQHGRADYREKKSTGTTEEGWATFTNYRRWDSEQSYPHHTFWKSCETSHNSGIRLTWLTSRLVSKLYLYTFFLFHMRIIWISSTRAQTNWVILAIAIFEPKYGIALKYADSRELLF